MLQLISLSWPDCLQSFDSFIPLEIQKIIASTDRYLIAYGAFIKEKPVGVCLALLNEGLHMLDVLHLQMAESYSTEEVGEILLKKVQISAIEKGTSVFSFVYEKNKEDRCLALEKIFELCSWKESRPFLIRAWFDPKTFDAPMIHHHYQYPPGYKEFLWKDLSESQKKDLLYREGQGHFSHAFSPFLEEDKIEPLNSLGLELKGRVVGWMLTHRLDSKTVRYSSLYIEPSLKFQSLAMQLLSNSIQLHRKSPTESAFIEIPYLYVSPSWIRFIKRRLLPSSTKVSYLWQRWKTS